MRSFKDCGNGIDMNKNGVGLLTKCVFPFSTSLHFPKLYWGSYLSLDWEASKKFLSGREKI